MRGTGRLKQALEESSFEAWTKFYKQDENAPNAIVSYYAKGALLALVLDLHIRLQTAGTRSLDDVMRHIWLQYGKTGTGLAEGEFEIIAEKISGVDLRPLFDMGVRSTEDLPIAEMLESVGIHLYLLPAQSQADKGGVVDKMPEIQTARPVLGANLATKNNEITLMQVYEGGAAQNAGLSAGDVLVAIDGLRMNEKQLEQYLAVTASDIPVRIHAFRRDELMSFELFPLPAPAVNCVFYLPESMAEEQRRLCKAWLHQDADTV